MHENIEAMFSLANKIIRLLPLLMPPTFWDGLFNDTLSHATRTDFLNLFTPRRAPDPRTWNTCPSLALALRHCTWLFSSCCFRPRLA